MPNSYMASSVGMKEAYTRYLSSLAVSVTYLLVCELDRIGTLARWLTFVVVRVTVSAGVHPLSLSPLLYDGLLEPITK